MQRKQVGNMLRDWEKKFPGRVESMFSALQNIAPSHLLDRKQHDFQAVRATGVPDADGDTAFDADLALADLPRLPTDQPVFALKDVR